MREDQLDLSTTERQLLFDIRSEMRKTNELLIQLLEGLNPIAKGLVLKSVNQKEVKPTKKRSTIPEKNKVKRGKKDA